MTSKAFLNYTEAAHLLSVHPRTISRGVRAGSIPSVCVGGSSRLSIPAWYVRGALTGNAGVDGGETDD
ncbi:helix-turn-helix domain-containing protein [Microbacterium sp. A84]|uniref:helix-turn-helix domain-containing protein n=1 Tax=Microbacterium sp. A84 TaxID=3450715 RepID=UPI003F439FD2